MNRYIYFLSLMLSLQLQAKVTPVTSSINGKLKSVFICKKTTNTTEVLRLYDMGKYEYLKYSVKPNEKETVERNIGNYTKIGLQLIIEKPEVKEFSGALIPNTYYVNDNLYKTAFQAKYLKKRAILFPKSSLNVYHKPYYFGLQSDVIVYKNHIEDAIDLKEVTSYLLKNKKTDKEKVIALANFISKSIEYDYEGLHSKNYAHDQSDDIAILSSSNRKAVCAGYAHVFKTLADSAGMKAKYLVGYTKQSLDDLNKLAGLHAWNKVTCDGKEYLIDVTWSDNGMYLDMKWMFVQPSIMIGSHIPYDKEDQLLEKPITNEVFMNTACMIPLKENVKLANDYFSAKYFVDSQLKLSFAQSTKIKIQSYSSTWLQTYYTDEPPFSKNLYTNNSNLDYTTKMNKDSLEFTIPLDQVIGGYMITVNDSYYMYFSAIKGSQKELMMHYVKTMDRQHALSFVNGIVASIQLGDSEIIQKTAGEKCSLILGKNNKLVLDENTLKIINKWNGQLSSLICSREISYKYNSEKKLEKTEKQVLYVEIPNGPRFILDKKGTNYELAAIEKSMYSFPIF